MNCIPNTTQYSYWLFIKTYIYVIVYTHSISRLLKTLKLHID